MQNTEVRKRILSMTIACFLCPALYTDGGDYVNCDYFSRWYWEQFIHSQFTKGWKKEDKKSYEKYMVKKIKEKEKALKKKSKKKIIPDIPISNGRIPLTDSGEKDSKSTIKNWSKFKLRE